MSTLISPSRLRLKKFLSSWCFRLFLKNVFNRQLTIPTLYAPAEGMGKVALLNNNFQIIEKILISTIINSLVYLSEGFSTISALLPSTGLKRIVFSFFIWPFIFPKIGPFFDFCMKEKTSTYHFIFKPFHNASTVSSMLYVLKCMTGDTITNTNG